MKKVFSHLNPSIDQRIRLHYAENYESMPIDENLIVYETRDGKTIVDSPYTLFLHLVSHPKYGNFRHVWIIERDDDALREIIPQQYRDKVKFVVRETLNYVEALLQAKYLISNSTFESFFSKRKGQIYINTWHGTPLKYMGFDIPFSIAASQNVLRNFLMTDYLLSPNSHTSSIFINGYKLNGIYTGEILEGGYPRIDQTITISQKDALTCITKYGTIVDDSLPIILYTPTWKGKNVNQASDDIDQIANETLTLAKKFKNKYQVLVKVHPFIFELAKNDKRINNYLVSDYVDANIVLAATDILITDYSSIFFDFLVTNKPILFYVWDKDLYENERGMYLSSEELPGPSAENLSELIYLLENLTESIEPYSRKYQALKKRMVPYDDGHTTERYIDYIFSGKTPKKMIVHKIDSRKTKLLLYPGGMKDNGITTSFLNLLDNIDYKKFDVTVVGNPPTSKEIEDNYSRMNKNVRPLFRFGIDILTAKERRLNRKFMSSGVSFSERNLYPETGYRRESNRITAGLSFDSAIDFSGYSFFWGRYILGAQAKKYCAFMHNDLYADAHREVNGKMPMLKNLTALFTIYYRFDRLLSVSPMTMMVNKEKLSQYISNQQMGYVINTININKILGHDTSHEASVSKDGRSNQNSILDLRASRRFLKFYKDEEISIFANTDCILSQKTSLFTVSITDKVSEFAQCTFDGKDYSKISINGIYKGWIYSELLINRPTVILERQKVHQFATVAEYLSSNIWKSLGESGLPQEAKTRAQYFAGQYLEVTEICKTDEEEYASIKYNGKGIGWISTRSLTRIHDVSLNLPLKFYFRKRQLQIHAEKKIGFSDTLVSTYMFCLIKDALHDDYLYSEPPKTTGSKILEASVSTIQKQVFVVSEVQFVDGIAYYLLQKNGENFGYVDSRNVIMITRSEFIKRSESISNAHLNSNTINEMSNDTFNFVTMGRLSPEKNQQTLIKAFGLFAASHPKSKLYILGKGPLFSELQKEIELLGLQKKVFLKGHLQNPFDFVSKADVFILPSLYEGQPMVLLETLTLGMKILASNIPANIQVIGQNEDYGLLTNGTSSQNIYEGMLRIYNFAGEFQHFDYDAYNRQAIENFYDEVTPNHF
ncbi:hypothetical protein BAU14_09840 [Enterococcus sp. CU9D]|nr:hypothetical protein BAU14_09840 [Enterococcus sp. CU9D]